MPDTTQPLVGLRVIDMADERGELCGRLLADLGAEVIRVEPPGGAVSRGLPPYAPDGTSLYFAYRNTNKTGVTIDLGTVAGLERLQALITDADVLIESERPGRLAELGLDPGRLTATDPRLIVASLTDFGQTGPDRHLVAPDDVVVARSGWLSLSGTPDRPPLLVPGTVAHDTLGVLGAFGVLLALLHRDRTGNGQWLDVSALEALAQMNTWGLPNASNSLANDSHPQTVRSGDSPMYPHFACADGHVRLVVLAPRQWRALWEWMGEPEAFADEYWAGTFNRLMNLDVINPLFADHWRHLPMVEGAAEAQRRGVVATPMLAPADVLASGHFASRGTFVDAEVAPGVSGPVMAGLFEIDGRRVGYRTPAPAIGDDDGAFGGLGTGEATNAPPPADLPLAGLRVVDFGHGGVGVECGRLLAEYGADVVKVESRSYPDFIRVFLGSEMTAAFASSSRSKRSIGLDLKHPDGRMVARRLVAAADVVIENNSTGTMDALGVGYDDLQAVNPDLLMVSSQLMGDHGTFAEWTGYGPTIQTAGGLSWLWAFDDGRPPPGSNAIHPDHLAGRVCAITVLAGLYGRARGAPGRRASVAQVEALIGTLGDLFLAEALNPGSVRPEGNDSARGAPWGVFPCVPDGDQEEWCVVTVRHDTDWIALRAAMGEPAWAADPVYADHAGRLTHRDALNAQVAAWTATLGPLEVEAACQAHGVPAGHMATTVRQLADPHLNGRGFIVPVDQPGLGPIVLEGPCIHSAAMADPVITAAPGLGQHTHDVCAEWLGWDAARVDGLIAAGALEAECGDN